MPRISDKQFQAAAAIVTTAIRTDPALYNAFQANIAMAVVDSARWYRAQNGRKRVFSFKDVVNVADKGSTYFLKLWLGEGK